MAEQPGISSRRIGRYVLHSEIAAGGMGTVHLGRMIGAAGFSRTVAIKRLHPHLAREAEFLAMFIDEARLASRIAHPNVVQTLDVVDEAGEVLVVMEYVLGESLASLLRVQPRPVPPPIAAGILVQMLYGLHAAHEAVGPDGRPIALVHRDVSPQNVVVGTDGVARLLDFGVAKATWRLRDTRDGVLRGKLGYMAPEQLAWEVVDRRADIYAASVVLWETLTGVRLFNGDAPIDAAARVRGDAIAPPSSVVPVAGALDAVVLLGLARDPDARPRTALEMAAALESAIVLASPREIAEWVAVVAASSLEERARRVRELEAAGDGVSTSAPPTYGHEARDRLAAIGRIPVDRDEATRVTPDSVATSAGGVASGASGDSRPRGRAILGVLALVLMGGGVAAIAIGMRHRPSSPGAGASLSSATAPLLSAGSTPASSTQPLGSASPAITPSSDEPGRAARAPVAAPRQGARPRAAGPAKASSSCNPNFTVDSEGMKHFKPECF
jgi:eukaryotic-like serine/threonine-protein kinase